MSDTLQPNRDEPKEYTRLEVIDHTPQGTGREYTKWVSEPFVVKFDEQDDGRTLKIFLSEKYKPQAISWLKDDCEA